MLPGFRFLFAATMLSMSLLIFGLGAAALLRAAHESFASNASWRAAPEVPFAQRPETTMPVLAALRVEPNSFDKTNEQTAVASAPTDQPMPAIEPARTEPARNHQVAALQAAETPPLEPAKPAELPTPASMLENPPAAEVVSPPAAATEPVAADERKVTVATAEATPVKSEPVAAPASQPQIDPAIATTETAPATEAAESAATMKIATLGGPPVDVTDDASIPLRTVKLPRARPDPAAIKKRVQARRAIQRRRLALRARLMLQQQQANSFGQPQSFPPTAVSH